MKYFFKSKSWLLILGGFFLLAAFQDVSAYPVYGQNLVGKPLSLKFKDVNGVDVDLSKMKGKVVLIDYWATWCVICLVELPEVQSIYKKYHSKGFEIVGISLDQDKEKLMAFTKKREMSWPQYFDGLGWKNIFIRKYEIESLPTMWLVDKKGILRDVDAREDLAGKIEKLLNEN